MLRSKFCREIGNKRTFTYGQSKSLGTRRGVSYALDLWIWKQIPHCLCVLEEEWTVFILDIWDHGSREVLR